MASGTPRAGARPARARCASRDPGARDRRAPRRPAGRSGAPGTRDRREQRLPASLRMSAGEKKALSSPAICASAIGRVRCSLSPAMTSDGPPRRLENGALLSHYRITDTLGAGGMGVVYRAVDTRLNRTVALKVIGDDAGPRDRRQRFIKEARAASAFNHPNIVTIHEVDAAGDIDFIVMEMVSGRSLDKRIAAGGLPIDEVRRAGRADRVGAGHGTCGRTSCTATSSPPTSWSPTRATSRCSISASPSSSRRPQPRCLDAVHSGDDEAGHRARLARVHVARTGAGPGRSTVDLTSFRSACCLYEMLSGRRPFGGSDRVETIAKILESAAAAHRDAFGPDVPPRWPRSSPRAWRRIAIVRPTARTRARPVVGDPPLTRGPSARRARRPAAPCRADPGGYRGSRDRGRGLWWWIAGRDVRDATPAPAGNPRASRTRRRCTTSIVQARTVVALLPDEPRLQQRGPT